MRYEGYVYVIDYGDGETFKIGHTIGDPETRLREIARTSVRMPDKYRPQLVMAALTCTNCRRLEGLLHLLFEERNVGGEWFRLDFVELVNLYQSLYSFGGVELYDRWYELVPNNYKRYIDGSAISPRLPWFTRKECIDTTTVALAAFRGVG